MSSAIINQLEQAFSDFVNHPYEPILPTSDPPPPIPAGQPTGECSWTPSAGWYAVLTCANDVAAPSGFTKLSANTYGIGLGDTNPNNVYVVTGNACNLGAVAPGITYTKNGVQVCAQGTDAMGRTTGLQIYYCAASSTGDPAPPPPVPVPPTTPPNAVSISVTIPVGIVNISPKVIVNPKVEIPITIKWDQPKPSSDPINYSWIRSIVRAELACIKQHICGQNPLISYQIPTVSSKGKALWSFNAGFKLKAVLVSCDPVDGISYFDGGLDWGDYGFIGLGINGCIVQSQRLEFSSSMILYSQPFPPGELYYKLTPNVSADIALVIEVPMN